MMTAARNMRDLLAQAAEEAAAETATINQMVDESLTDPDKRGVLITRDTYTWRVVKAILSAGVPQGTVKEDRL